MPLIARSLFLLLATLLALCATGQQKIYPAERLDRATKTDDKGLVQWDAWKIDKCANCSGAGKTKCITCARFDEDSPNCPECKRNKEREAPCRTCAGTGAFPDPLEKVPCPACFAASFLLCTVCGGGGRLKIEGGNIWSACPACRGEGGFKCTVCSGSRLVEVAALKPSLKDANLKDLAKAATAVDASLKALEAVAPKGGDGARKEVKAMVKALEPAQGAFPPIKRTIKQLEDYLGKIYAGRQFVGSEENESESMQLVQQGAVYYLKHQKRMLELVQKRAEANAKVQAEQKGK